MKRLPWKLRGSRVDLKVAGIPDSVVLVPETEADRIDILQALEMQGVSNSMAFSKDDINGRIDLPAEPQWESDGAMPVTITTADGPIPAWFWLIEIEDDEAPGRRFAWWGTQRNSDRAWAWSV